MDTAEEEEEQKVAMETWKEKILFVNLSARCQFSYIIMAKGGYLVGLIIISVCMNIYNS